MGNRHSAACKTVAVDACVCAGVCVSRPDSLTYKSEVVVMPQGQVVSDKRSSSSVRGTAPHTRDSSPATLRHKEMSQSVSSDADSASSLSKLGSV